MTKGYQRLTAGKPTAPQAGFAGKKAGRRKDIRDLPDLKPFPLYPYYSSTSTS